MTIEVVARSDQAFNSEIIAAGALITDNSNGNCDTTYELHKETSTDGTTWTTATVDSSYEIFDTTTGKFEITVS